VKEFETVQQHSVIRATVDFVTFGEKIASPSLTVSGKQIDKNTTNLTVQPGLIQTTGQFSADIMHSDEKVQIVLCSFTPHGHLNGGAGFKSLQIELLESNRSSLRQELFPGDALQKGWYHSDRGGKEDLRYQCPALNASFLGGPLMTSKPVVCYIKEIKWLPSHSYIRWSISSIGFNSNNSVANSTVTLSNARIITEKKTRSNLTTPVACNGSNDTIYFVDRYEGFVQHSKPTAQIVLCNYNLPNANMAFANLTVEAIGCKDCKGCALTPEYRPICIKCDPGMTLANGQCLPFGFIESKIQFVDKRGL
jgi:hypothetical protein